MKFALATIASLALGVLAEDSWQVRHMKHEHGIDSFDALSFFTLHDSDGSKTWTRNDILNLYGLLRDKVVGDGSGVGDNKVTKEITEQTRDQVVNDVLRLIDLNGDGVISMEEWRIFTNKGGELPDFGLGPGHHGDYEHEYEVHHWLEYHAQNDPDVNIVHPEDIEHERMYHSEEHGDDLETHQDVIGSWAKIENIPSKFRVVH
uniref:ARAD1D39556p n=1 Tax=Blastobotrys adeninivorans TaxID=409370 RepID=A0A060TIM6_BLAAD